MPKGIMTVRVAIEPIMSVALTLEQLSCIDFLSDIGHLLRRKMATLLP